MYFSQTDPKPTSMLETILQHLKMQNIVSSLTQHGVEVIKEKELHSTT